MGEVQYNTMQNNLINLYCAIINTTEVGRKILFSVIAQPGMSEIKISYFTGATRFSYYISISFEHLPQFTAPIYSRTGLVAQSVEHRKV